MKKLLTVLLAFCLTIFVNGQRSPVDEIFEKYSEREGFSVVYISGKMFNMFSELDKTTNNKDKVISNLKSIRILSVEDSTLNESVNLYKELEKKLDLSVYEELMVTKSGKNTTKFLTIQKGDIIKELLVITGGPAGNSLISIKGDMNLKALSELSKDTGIQELEELEDVDKKNH
ncbi:MAG: hypothetical protein A2X05_06485 [Bacteroidetes bacterium GWE2_41_25]|nr:MAG: hypothetical protein A2X03_04255 [Bacteroidetes bacterium GWA2_40_15]OFX91980.1 MAG: hypothetical protein A2X06_02405 [Bacteroidetes bacterium GWC2_40_22]OFY13301.1 MAG: hypothetical protein A2X05_06485 [Bacteroidetes bacterium GWE2_41_25]OFY58899.1 MAG: hypothetical protein A2X04_07150 [Bacteroidetes bacterium GWF2_41_9]HAM09210.1 hypothetical protein [Bacteroidales bacterium]